MHRWLRILLFAAVATGCTDASAPNPNAVLVVESDPIVATVDLAGEVEWLHATVPVAIHNTGGTTLELGACSAGIDGQVGDEWRDVWRPYCSLINSAPIEIAPRASLRFPLSVTAAVGGRGGPRWNSDEVEGTYRLIMYLNEPGGGSGLKAASNTFALTLDE